MRPIRYLVVAFALCPLLSVPASAATFKPTRLDDPAPNKCKPRDCSLREAIDAANAEPNRDTIRLAKGTYEIERPHVPGSGNNETGDLSVSYPVTIRGKGSKATRVDANRLDRVFFVGGVLSEKPVRFHSLTIKGGDPDAVPDDPQHPPIGGGIYAYTEAVTLRDVAIRRNQADSGGGARFQVTALRISKSTISRNTAAQGGGIQFPSAIFESPVATIRGTTISGNSAAKGGGVLAEAATSGSLEPPVVTLSNSTVAGNLAGGGGGTAEGGGALAANGATLTLDNSTVAYNEAGALAQNGMGGGIYQQSGAVFSLGDSVIAQNSVGQSGMFGTILPGAQCAGAFQGSGGVVVELQNGTVCSISGDLRQPDNADTEPLANNGGPTKTVAIAPPSVAIGYAVTCPPRDQRGVARPAIGCDSGAFERP